MANFLGLPYPVVKNPLGFFRTQSGVSQIKSDLLSLLLTNPGERVFLSDFGTPLKRLIFEQNDTILENMAKNMIAEAISIWEPRIAVNQIEVSRSVPSSSLNAMDPGEDVDNILYIKITFIDPEQISEVQELRLQIPLT
jgi:phage baseplate assembly protein W